MPFLIYPVLLGVGWLAGMWTSDGLNTLFWLALIGAAVYFFMGGF